MTTPENARAPRRSLPERPSKENLKKQAKRLAKKRALQLADAQRDLAHEYGFVNWAALMQAVEAASPAPQMSALAAAAARADEAAVRALLAQGANVDGDAHDVATPLYYVCDSDAPAEQRLAVAQALLEAGAFPRGWGPKGATPLHAAARRGPAPLVRLLLRNKALFWQGDDKGKRPYDWAQKGSPADREKILYLLQDYGPRTTDQGFLQAIAAIQQGDVETLKSLLDARPALLHERIIEKDLDTRGYFSDPKLFWFIANNPTLVERSPDNIVEVTKAMLARGVEQEDKNYALALVVTNSNFVGSQQIDLVRVLAEAGADPGDMLGSLGHGQRAPAAWLVENGYLAPTAPIAAGLGRVSELPALLAAATPESRTDSLGMAVINREHEAARFCLEVGADVDRFMACHTHSTPLHQAAVNGDVEMLKLLISYRARTDIRDTLWRGRALGWAQHGAQKEAEAYLRAVMTERGEGVD